MKPTSRRLAACALACALSTSAAAAAQTAPPPPSAPRSPWVTSMPPASPSPYAPRPAWQPPSPYAPPPGYWYWPGYPVAPPRPASRPPRARTERPPMSSPKIGMITGGTALGAGWLASVLMALIAEAAGVRCTHGYWGIPACSHDDIDRDPLLIPVVGPFLLLQDRRVAVSEKTAAAVLGSLQTAGLATFAISLAVHLNSSDTPAPAVTLRLAPAAGPGGGGLGLTGTF